MQDMTGHERRALGTVAVTGGAGFIGSHLVQALLAEGNRVRIIDNFDSYYQGKEANLLAVRDHPALTLDRTDILDTQALSRSFEAVDVVFHLAAQPGVRFSFENREKTRSVNVDGTRSVLEAASAAGARRLVFASSSSVYGLLETLPVSERQVPKPISPYGQSKIEGEHLLNDFYASGRIETVALRLFSVFGPRQRPDMAGTRFLQRLTSSAAPLVTGDGMQTRDFTYVEDVARAFVAAARSERAAGDALNIGTGRESTLKRFLSLIVDFLGLKDSAVEHTRSGEGEPGRMRCDARRAEHALDWRATVGLPEGLRKQVDWWVNEFMPDEERRLFQQRMTKSHV
ncbi:MAG: GDP-mannose 4,6-dehydratase [Candidatus Eisenbacteria sp.]|nr:GDP-mannose 4,6-dehydratase [Candidatus Eisenbacteria bacterium]